MSCTGRWHLGLDPGERFQRVPDGSGGGGAPKPSAARLLRADGTTEPLGPRSAVKLDTGDKLVIESCGGAGFGARPVPLV
ncbi:hypothetical protein E2K80_11805 [Rhodophyticola sp. CCM32]|nr:hypothetical protein E2K80_11805 [Rhodophyticola sp. CCM32]